MDIEKLIEDLRIACAGNQHNIMGVAATAIETLRAENVKLQYEEERQRRSADDMRHLYENAERAYTKVQADLARMTAERDAAIECLKNKCPFCRKYLTCQGRTINNDCWEFFGLKED